MSLKILPRRNTKIPPAFLAGIFVCIKDVFSSFFSDKKVLTSPAPCGTVWVVFCCRALTSAVARRVLPWKKHPAGSSFSGTPPSVCGARFAPPDRTRPWSRSPATRTSEVSSSRSRSRGGFRSRSSGFLPAGWCSNSREADWSTARFSTCGRRGNLCTSSPVQLEFCSLPRRNASSGSLSFLRLGGCLVRTVSPRGSSIVRLLGGGGDSWWLRARDDHLFFMYETGWQGGRSSIHSHTPSGVASTSAVWTRFLPNITSSPTAAR